MIQLLPIARQHHHDFCIVSMSKPGLALLQAHPWLHANTSSRRNSHLAPILARYAHSAVRGLAAMSPVNRLSGHGASLSSENDSTIMVQANLTASAHHRQHRLPAPQGMLSWNELADVDDNARRRSARSRPVPVPRSPMAFETASTKVRCMTPPPLLARTPVYI